VNDFVLANIYSNDVPLLRNKTLKGQRRFRFMILDFSFLWSL